MAKGERGGESFDPAKWARLESPERRERMPPEALAEALGLAGAELVVDIGCGTGYFAEALASRCAQYFGVDHSSDMLGIFRDKGLAERFEGLRIEQSQADKLPLATASVDLALHVALLHELSDIPTFHREMRRVLGPEGRLVTVDWEAKETPDGPPLEHRLPRERAIELLERDRFMVIEQPEVYPDHYVLIARAR